MAGIKFNRLFAFPDAQQYETTNNAGGIVLEILSKEDAEYIAALSAAPRPRCTLGLRPRGQAAAGVAGLTSFSAAGSFAPVVSRIRPGLVQARRDSLALQRQLAAAGPSEASKPPQLGRPLGRRPGHGGRGEDRCGPAD